MKQYQLSNNVLTLKVKKAPFIVRSILFLLAFSFFLLPLTGMIAGLGMGKGMHIRYLIGLFLFGVMGFYLLRIALWNTFGQETITFKKNKIEYIADYGWFKDGEKQKEINRIVEFGIRQIGYEEDNKGVLVIGLEEPNIICATKMPREELEELIDKLNNLENLW